MADPVIVVCVADAWTIVATNVTTGTVNIQDKPLGGGFFQTYRLTGVAAPTNLDDATPFGDDGFRIQNSLAIDAYVYAKGDAGSVKVSV